jgi:hypothetical protein
VKDIATKQPLRVSGSGKASPFINVPVSQLGAIQRLLEQHGVPHFVDEFFISLNGAPEEAMVILSRSGDSIKVQRILDSVE